MAMSMYGERRRRRRRAGRGLLTSIVGALTGLGRRRRRRVHRRRTTMAAGRRRRYHRYGRGFLDTLKSIGSAALPVIGNIAKDVGTSLIKKKLGIGRRRRRVHRHRYGGLRRRIIRV